jgi:hypothetical protein
MSQVPCPREAESSALSESGTPYGSYLFRTERIPVLSLIAMMLP